VRIFGRFQPLGDYIICRMVLIDGNEEEPVGLLTFRRELWRAVRARIFDQVERVQDSEE